MSTTPISISRSIDEEVKTGLTKVNERVRAAMVEALSQKEFQRRVEATTKVLEKFEETERELRKIKPTHSGYGLDGKPIGDPIYSKEQVEAHKRATEQLTKLNNALEKALNDNDFSKVFEIAGNK